ncbi:CB042-like protein [Mya arenaria]|uniref:CB042-like protein n=1 Tax=Mya arenaria TaxID=6604 RepID=A0ABY7FK45_MYAAR|nr:CB042-like protein [Mya arenaria]
MTSQEKMKSLFEDLGKATLRGVRKCPKCGTFNGTRGISCKNKQCDVVFKEKEKKKGNSIDAVKIVTGSTVQVFSVRLRDRGPDYRGFVQLPLVQDLDGNPAQVVDVAILASAARCYVDSCSRSSVVGTQDACPHIKAAIECSTEAQPLTLKNSVLNSLQVNNDIKQAIWLLATETTGPLVQRVTKSVMVVKCKPNPKQPLGFLHFSFFDMLKGKSQNQTHKFHCACKPAKNFSAHKAGDEAVKRCVHYYACVCAFASDDKLQEEFSAFISQDFNPNSVTVSVSNNALGGSFVEEFVELQDEASLGGEEQLVTVYETDAPHETWEVVVAEEPVETPTKKKRKEEIVQASSALLTLQEGKGQKPFVASKTTPLKAISTPGKKPEETEVVASFHSWLGSVTERINQTMHYQFDGNPDPLVFHAPQFFFECLQQRISQGQKKKRLPNFTTAFVRRDALPLGTFTKYTWHITNILHVKQIFDTPEMTMEITRNFVENRDSTYDLYEVPKMEDIGDRMAIRPTELKTYLKVGNTTADQRDPTPFIIEWIPDILPKSHIGELRIKFEYGHQRNGHIEHRGGVVSPTSEAQGGMATE